MAEPSIWDFVDPVSCPVLPRESRATLARFDEEKRFALARCRALGHEDRHVEDVWPRYMDTWMIEETVITTRAVADHLAAPRRDIDDLVVGLN